MCTPDLGDFVPDTTSRLSVRMGITEYQATCYCDVGLMLQRFPLVAEQLDTGAFSWMLVRKIQEDLFAVSDERVEDVDAAAAEALKPSRPGQCVPARSTIHHKLRSIVEELEKKATPLDDDERNLSYDATEPITLDIDRRPDDFTIFRIQLPKLDGVEVEKAVRNVAVAEGCSMGEALMKLIRKQVTTTVTLNLYRNVAHEGPELFAAGSWLSEIATEEWMAKVTHLAAPGYDRNNGYHPNDSVSAAVEGRDGTCRAPGCDVPAHRCQKDHIKRYNHDDPEAGGPTSTANLHLLCSKHHRQKTAGSWDVEMSPDGTETWTSFGDGHTVITTPNGPLGRETFGHRAVRRAKAVRDHNEIKESEGTEDTESTETSPTETAPEQEPPDHTPPS